MSDSSQGPGWWQASDGKWYPPQTAPGVPQPIAPAPAAPGGGGSNRTLLIVLGVIGVLMVLGIGGCALFIFAADSVIEEGLDSIEEGIESLNENNAEVVGSDDPGNTGTLDDPLPMGTEVDLANGWRVTVNSADLDSDAAVAAANEFNDPPEPGMRFIVVNLTAAYDGNDEGTPEFPAITNALFGSDGVERNSFDTFATPPDPRFDSIGELTPGGEATGNIVFQVGAEEDDLVMRIEPVFSLDSSQAWFSLDN